jgi:hypothetical protein
LPPPHAMRRSVVAHKLDRPNCLILIPPGKAAHDGIRLARRIMRQTGFLAKACHAILTMLLPKARSSLFLIPDIQEGGIAGGGHFSPTFVDGAIQSRPHLLFTLGQLCQGDFDRGTARHLIKIREDFADYLAVFAPAALGNIELGHGSEVHRSLDCAFHLTPPITNRN